MEVKPSFKNFFKNLGQDYVNAGKDIYNISSDLIKGIKNKEYRTPCAFIKTAFNKARDFTLNHALVTTITIVALTLISLVTFQLLLIIPMALGALALSNGTPFFKALIHESTYLFPRSKNSKETLLGNKRLNASEKRCLYKNFSFKEIHGLESLKNKAEKTYNSAKGFLNNFLENNPTIKKVFNTGKGLFQNTFTTSY